MTSNPTRLHVAAIILFALKYIKERFFILFAFSIFAIEDVLASYLVLIVGLGLILILLFFSWLKWFRFSYSFEGTDLRIEHGVIIRKKRTISKYRVQSVKLNQNILHRILGLTGMQIETAGSDMDVDANLVALKLSDAEQLRKQLKSTDDNEQMAEEYDYDYALEKELPKYEASYKRLFAYGSTSGGFGLIIVVILFVLSELINFIPDQLFDQTTSWIINQTITTIIVLVFLTLVVIWFLGVFGTIIKHGDFTIIRYEHELYISRGLLEKKQLTIPLNRIQAVSFKQNPIRLPFKFGSLTIVIAGGEVNQKEAAQTMIFPFIRQSEINPFLAKILPEYNYHFDQLQSIPRRNFYFSSSISLLISLIVTTLFLVFLPAIWWIGPVAFIFGVGYEWLNYKLTKTAVTTDQIMLQLFSRFSKETVCLKQDRIQALEQRQSFIQRKLKIANHQVSVLDNFMGKHYSVQGLSIKRAEEIADWYSYRDAYKLEDLNLTLE